MVTRIMIYRSITIQDDNEKERDTETMEGLVAVFRGNGNLLLPLRPRSACPRIVDPWSVNTTNVTQEALTEEVRVEETSTQGEQEQRVSSPEPLTIEQALDIAEGNNPDLIASKLNLERYQQHLVAQRASLKSRFSLTLRPSTTAGRGDSITACHNGIPTKR